MNVSRSSHGIQFFLSISHQICVLQSEDNEAKSFVLKSLLGAQFNGFKYIYYDWRTYKTIDWFGGHIYDRYSVVVFDDADLYINSVLRVIPSMKCTAIIVANRSNSSMVLRGSVKAKSYEIVCDNASFTLRPCPSICAYCGRVFPDSRLTTEHIIPQKFCDTYMPGAPIKNHYRNRLLTCFECNRKKSDDILIPMYNKSGWMKYMTREQVGGYSDIFVSLLSAQHENVVNWIYVKNMQSHVPYKLNYEETRKLIESEIEFFLRRYIDRKPGEYWALI